MSAEAHGARRVIEPLDVEALIEKLPALVVCILADGSAEFTNRAWQEYTGHRAKDLVGSDWQTPIHPDDRGKFLDEGSLSLMSGESSGSEVRIRRANGQYSWFLLRKTLAVARNSKGEVALRTLIACEDIDERKEQELARRTIEQRYRLMVETANDAVVSMDESGLILLANPATVGVFGYEPAELIGKPLTVLMPEFLRKVHDDGLRRYLATGERHLNWHGTELTGLHKNGGEFPVEISFGEEVTADGRRIFTGFVRDISERKQTEELRASLHATRVALAHANRVATMGQLSTSIAHEVNQPIAAAVTNAQAGLHWLGTEPPNFEEIRQALYRIVRNGNRAIEVISRIRALVKKSPPRKEGLEINELIREVVALTHGEVVTSKVSVQMQLEEDLAVVHGDRVQLQQVILNLIVNAVEAMGEVSAGPRELLISSAKGTSSEVIVAVRDSGPGLSAAGLERIFEPFYTTKLGGLGIGLAICRSIIEAHEGRLWASEGVPRGAIFQFALPAVGNSERLERSDSSTGSYRCSRG